MRATVRREIAELAAVDQKRREPPAEAEIRLELSAMADVLVRAATSDDPEELAAARRVIEALTGGQIMLTQCGERKPKLGWWGKCTPVVCRYAGRARPINREGCAP